MMLHVSLVVVVGVIVAMLLLREIHGFSCLVMMIHPDCVILSAFPRSFLAFPS